ncbi:hypothetical protein CROQUDRAFT_668413 [Cronartium quercuum f. sp. fusiforme G11]|uniref:Protein kinase domain-containing protein n=1 Tax=Cronartium quercuum f. sp. fusiforme G11 TaxID=708437 RepID=A0A9P6TFM1_9BASI|nr:hypothetical protein CROQUDRAFT_668413 [Cronartium quercuum f. sp. fusiforme G11]
MDYTPTVKYLVQISAGLDSLHSFEIIYRDLKPQNVLLTGSGQVRLGDFGLSKDLSGTDERTKSVCGTVRYMALEVIWGKDYTYSVDCPLKKKNQKSQEIDKDGQDFIRWLTKSDPKERPLNISEIKTHPWVRELPWSEIMEGKVVPPYILTLHDIFMTRMVYPEEGPSETFEAKREREREKSL